MINPRWLLTLETNSLKLPVLCNILGYSPSRTGTLDGDLLNSWWFVAVLMELGQHQLAPGLRGMLVVPKGLGFSIYGGSQSFTRPQRGGPHSGFCTLPFPFMIFSFVSSCFFLLSSVEEFLTSVANIYHNVQIHDSLVK